KRIAGGGSNLENQNTGHRRMKITDGAKYEEVNSGGTRQSMNNADDQRTKMLVDGHSSQHVIQPSHRCLFRRVRVVLRFMPVGMGMNIVAMAVKMAMHDSGSLLGVRGGLGHGTQKTHHVHEAQNDQHQSH